MDWSGENPTETPTSEGRVDIFLKHARVIFARLRRVKLFLCIVLLVRCGSNVFHRNLENPSGSCVFGGASGPPSFSLLGTWLQGNIVRKKTMVRKSSEGAGGGVRGARTHKSGALPADAGASRRGPPRRAGGHRGGRRSLGSATPARRVHASIGAGSPPSHRGWAAGGPYGVRRIRMPRPAKVTPDSGRPSRGPTGAVGWPSAADSTTDGEIGWRAAQAAACPRCPPRGPRRSAARSSIRLLGKFAVVRRWCGRRSRGAELLEKGAAPPEGAGGGVRGALCFPLSTTPVP